MKRSNAIDDYMRTCPSHGDVNASLHVTELADGRTLLHCFAGCEYPDIVSALDRESKGARTPAPARREPASRSIAIDPPKPVTVATLAKERKLPVEFLKSLGVRDLPFRSGIAIPYRDERGSVVLTKHRHYLTLTDAQERSGLVKFRWPARTPLLAYGLDRLAIARRRKKLVLIEGESDSWTLWHHGVPALGIPGAASVARTLEASHLIGIDELAIVQESDRGGVTFVREIAARLRAIGFKGEVFVLDMSETRAKDASDLYLQKPKTFKTRFASWAR